MHPKVLSAKAWKTIRSIVAAGLADGWMLAGGTGLALQIGHRYSEDLDFFRSGAFDVSALIDRLTAVGDVAVQDRTKDTLHAVVHNLRTSFLSIQAPLLFRGTAYRGLMLADPRDIAVMKVIAIGGHGSRKDFVDLYFLLRGGLDIPGIFALLGRRFGKVDYNEYHLLKSLVYFADADAEPMPRMLRRVDWEDVKEEIRNAVRRVA